MMVAATEFDPRAIRHCRWPFELGAEKPKAPLVKLLAAQRLVVVQLQQKKYTEALATLATPVEADFEPLLLETKGDVYAAEGKK